MEGTIVHAVYQSSMQIGENITFDMKNAVRNAYFLTVNRTTGEQALVPKNSVKAHSPENVEDISFLHDLAKEIQKHDRIIIYHRFPFGGGLYAFEDENPLVILSKDFSGKSYRCLFTKMIQNIALAEGKTVFSAYHNTPDKGYTLNHVILLPNGLKKEEFVCVKERSIPTFYAFKNFGREEFRE